MNAAFLTACQLVARWNGVITTGTLANWRTKKVGPSYMKMRGRVLYPLDSVIKWEAENQREIAQNDNDRVIYE